MSGLLAALLVAYVLKETGSEELAVAAGAAATAVLQYLGKLLRNYAAGKGVEIHTPV